MDFIVVLAKRKKGWKNDYEVHDLPTPPILQKEAFLTKKKPLHDLPFFGPKKKEVDHGVGPLDGGSV